MCVLRGSRSAVHIHRLAFEIVDTDVPVRIFRRRLHDADHIVVARGTGALEDDTLAIVRDSRSPALGDWMRKLSGGILGW